ncbi:MAG: TadE/TadG family type IV pilus assembly protein [Pseudomonadota bacterium]
MSAFNLKSTLKRGATFFRNDHGGAAIIMGLMTPIIIGGLAFGAEVGGWELTKRQVQNAADTAAFAAGTQVRSGSSLSTITAAAAAVAQESGYEGGVEGVSVEYPPSTAPLAADGADPNGDNRFVYVTLTQTEDRLFTKYFSSGSNTVTFTSSALARVENGRPACVLALDPGADGAITAGGSSDATLTGCDIAANSISQSAVYMPTSAPDVVTNCVTSVGGTDIDPEAIHLTECAAPIENAPLTADPYRDVPEPSVTGCVPASQFTSGGGGSVTKDPGCYGTSSGANTTINVNKTINLNPGTYIFNNVDLKLSGNGWIKGTGVTLYFAGDSTVTVTGSSKINIFAPLSGTYKGIAIFGARDPAAGALDLTGSSGVAVVGAIYAPKSDVTFTGSTDGFSSGHCTQVIGGTVTFWGSADFTTDCTNSGTAEIKTAQSIKIVG